MSYSAKAIGQLRLSIHNIVLEELEKCSYSSWRENSVYLFSSLGSDFRIVRPKILRIKIGLKGKHKLQL
jgi:hypothetical protein